MKKLAAWSTLVLFLAACGVDTDIPETNTPTVSLAASPQSGPAPLTVTLTATASDLDGDLTYAWSRTDGTRSADGRVAVFTLETPGEYPLSVTVSDGQESASANVTVSVTPGTVIDPEPPTEPTDPTDSEATLEVTASPGGKAPWGVRYDVTASGFPEDSTLQTVCRVRTDPGTEEGIRITDNQIDEDSFACFYPGPDAAGSGFVRVVSESGATLDEVALTPKITENDDPLYFSGTWRYTYREAGAVTKTGTFALVKPFSTGGSSEDGSFILQLDESDGEAVPDYSDDNAGVGSYLIPEPLPNGTQRYVSSSKNVVLEQID